MSKNRTVVRCLAEAAVLLSLPACDGIFGGIYDEPASDVGYGFVFVDDHTHRGRIRIDASAYTEWHYVDLHEKRVTTVEVGGEAPGQWDFALHRYDAKTNGGAVAECAADDFGSLPAIGSLPPEAFAGDEWTTDRIAVDMSQMMDGIVVYAEDWYNGCLSRWLRVDTSTMPPVYTLSGKIYVLRLADGTHAALRLVDFMNDAAEKGYLTVDYLYPVEP